MSYSEEILSQFDSYTAGKMTPDERDIFEASLEKDVALKQAFDDYLNLTAGLSAFGYAEISEKITEWEAEIVAETETKVVPLKRWYMIAATISLLMVAAFSWWKFGIQDSSEDLYASYYQPYPDILTSRGAGETLMSEALYSYESGNYDLAIDKLNQVLADDQDNSELRFYLGQAYLANSDAINAQAVFKALINEKNFALSDASQWYLALAYLKTGDTIAAKEMLQQINRDTNHAYREKSKQLIERLN
ncbi:MAG: tetratricopeptide repeat protein [Bacteroidota bacterium]